MASGDSGAMATALSGHVWDEACPRKAVGMAPNNHEGEHLFARGS
jgi:hypothetical protein